MTPTLRVDKECIPLGVPIRTGDDGREPFDLASLLYDEHATIDYLWELQLDGIWIRQQGFAVIPIIERRSPLERFKRLPL